MLCKYFFAETDILSEKNPCFGKHFYCKTRSNYAYKLRVQLASRLVRISLLISNLNKEFCFFLKKVILQKQ